jgi:hypothetical protein
MVIGRILMVEIITIDNKRYVIDEIQHKSDGVIFEYLKEPVFISHHSIKTINLNYQKVSAKTYRSK